MFHSKIPLPTCSSRPFTAKPTPPNAEKAARLVKLTVQSQTAPTQPQRQADTTSSPVVSSPAKRLAADRIAERRRRVAANIVNKSATEKTSSSESAFSRPRYSQSCLTPTIPLPYHPLTIPRSYAASLPNIPHCHLTFLASYMPLVIYTPHHTHIPSCSPPIMPAITFPVSPIPFHHRSVFITMSHYDICFPSLYPPPITFHCIV